ncbi:hypothetical protein G9P44_003175 [Scheffersomyces stipitis]|nr:hypothetical protein G9P44_003175 [Scheffersomyces stipitis]
MSSQISSVGFTNLKKLNTNTSSISTASSATSKTNPLTRLFTRNRSVSNVFQQPHGQGEEESVFNNSDDDVSTLVSESKKTNGAKFRLPKSKLKFAGKTTSNKPDLSIQTNGHHGLRVSKKILSSTSIDDPSNYSNRKNSMSSPVSTFHSLFHRSHSNSQVSGENSILASKEESPNQSKMNNPTRTTVSLSSNNSNSYITDVNFAMIYNFTDPNYSVDEMDGLNDHSSFLDIHKKLMISDQFVPSKTHKSQNAEVGLGIMSEHDCDNEYLSNYQMDFGKKNSRFFSNLLYITKPLFLASQQKRLSNGVLHPHTGYTVEDVANFIKENYLSDISSGLPYDSSTGSPVNRTQKVKSKSNRLISVASSSSISIREEIGDSLDDFKIREISQDLFTFFTKSMIVFQRDFNNFETKTYDNILSSTLQNKSKPVVNVILSWSKISMMWDYFNCKIRFYLLSIFLPLQKIFHEISIQRLTSIQQPIEIENIILLAFRDIILLPLLLHRRIIYQGDTFNSISNGRTKQPTHGPEELTMEEEESVLCANKKLLQKLVNCFGILSSYTHAEPGNADGEQHVRNEIFQSAVIWISKVEHQLNNRGSNLNI